MEDHDQPSPQQPKSYHLAARGGASAKDSPALSPSPEQHRRRAFTEDEDTSQVTGSTGIDLHQEIALAVRQAISTHNSAYQSALTRSEEQWRQSKEEALLAAEERFEQRLEEAKHRFVAEHAVAKESMLSALRVAQDDQVRLKQELVSAQAAARKLQQSADEHRDTTISLAAHKQQLLARELQLQAKDLAHKDALRTQKMAFDAALSRAEAQLRHEQEHVSVQVAMRETQVRAECAVQLDALQQAHAEELQRVKEEAEEQIQQLQDELAAEREAHDLTLNSLEKMKLKAMRAVGSSSKAPPLSPAQLQGGTEGGDALSQGGVVTSPMSPANAEFMSTLKALRQQSAAKVAGDPSASEGGPSAVALRLQARAGAVGSSSGATGTSGAALGSLALPETDLMRIAASLDMEVDDAEVLGAGASLSGSVEIAPDGAVGTSISPRLGGRDVPSLVAPTKSSSSGATALFSLGASPGQSEVRQVSNQAQTQAPAAGDHGHERSNSQPPPPAGHPPSDAQMEDGSRPAAVSPAQQQQVMEEDQDELDLLHAELLRLQAQLTQAVAANRTLAAQFASVQGEVAFAAAVRPMFEGLKEEFQCEVQRAEALQGALNEATEMVSQLKEQLATVQDEAAAQAQKSAADAAAAASKAAAELSQVKEAAVQDAQAAAAVISELRPQAAEAAANRALVADLQQRLAQVMHAFIFVDARLHSSPASGEGSSAGPDLWPGSLAPILDTLSQALSRAKPAMDKVASVAQSLTSKSEKLITASEALLDNSFSADPAVDIRLRPFAATAGNGSSTDDAAADADSQLIKDVASKFAAMRDLSLAAVRQTIETLYPLAGVAAAGTGGGQGSGGVKEMTIAEGGIERPDRPVVPATLAHMIVTEALQQAQDIASAAAPDLSHSTMGEAQSQGLPAASIDTGLEEALHAIAAAAEQTLSMQTAAQFAAEAPGGESDRGTYAVLPESSIISAWASRYSALAALLSVPVEEKDAGSRLSAARACIEYLAIVAKSSLSSSAQATVEFMRGILEEHARATLKHATRELESRAEAIMQSQSPRQTGDAPLLPSPGQSASDIMSQLMSTLSGLRESVLSVEHKHSALLAQAAVQKEAAATALTSAMRTIAHRDRSIVQIQSRAVEELQRHETALLAGDAAVQAVMQLESAVHSLQSRVEVERSTFLHRRTAWAEATSVLVSALQALEAQLATLQRFEEARAPYMARAAIIASGLPNQPNRAAESIPISRKASFDSGPAHTAKTGAESAATGAGKAVNGGGSAAASQRSATAAAVHWGLAAKPSAADAAPSVRGPPSVSGQSVPLELSQPSQEDASARLMVGAVPQVDEEDAQQVLPQSAQKTQEAPSVPLASATQEPSQPLPSAADDAAAITKALALAHGGGSGAGPVTGRSSSPRPQSMVSSYHSLSSTYATSAYLNSTLANGAVAFSSPSSSRSAGYFGSTGAVGLAGVTSPTYRPTSMAAALSAASGIGSPSAPTFSPRLPGRLPPAAPL